MPTPVLSTVPLGSPPWPTLDPFLFCVHHHDLYPAGDERMAPQASLAGRNIGSDFGGKDGWSMYHGDSIPGFPQHPHRGFETVTIARQGLIDHSDSTGATARFGLGDVQWMTAGKGVVHSEMFPLVNRDADNPTELFQIWLNLPRKDKMVDPYFTMLWDHTIPRLREPGVEVAMYAGALGDHQPPAPPPNSWASRAESDIAIWTITLEPGGAWTIPAAPEGAHRVLYYFKGATLGIGPTSLTPGHAVQLDPTQEAALQNGTERSEILVLQGRPIGEPVVKHGPFVMNTADEIRQAIRDYQSTRFGGWPWGRNDPAHDREAGRFAVHSDGRREEPPTT